MTTAASKGYALASSWERSAPLSEKQLVLVSALSSECIVPPFPEHCQDKEAETAALGGALSIDSTLPLHGTKANGDEGKQLTGTLQCAHTHI